MKASKIKEKIAVLFAKHLHKGFEGKKAYSEDEVYLFSKNSQFAGVTLYTGSILLNELLFEEGNEDILEYIYLHEKHHQKDSIIANFLGGSGQMILSPVYLGIHSLTLIISIIGAINLANFLPTLPFYSIIFGDLTLILGAIIASQYIEIRSELYAVRNIGIDNFRQSYEKLEEVLPDRGFLAQVSFLLTHPTPGTVEKIYSIFEEE